MAKTIVVTGANGQLGTVLKGLADTMPGFTFVFTDVADLDITKPTELKHFFNLHAPKYLINCAAYTAVDKAESEPKIARLINAKAVELMAMECKMHKTKFIQVSTDYVFDGIASNPYVETDFTNPMGVYALTKAEGEEALMLSGCDGYVFRTSWLYSVHGHNFLKTILRLAAERETLNIVYDQVGTPTLADDLAKAIFTLITALDNKQKVPTGIYHFSNEGVASWYDFARAIVELAGLNCKVMPILTKEYPTPAARPAYSLLHKGKVKAALGIEIPHWRESLKEAVAKML
jgi:dTDP-4-dehydrorhamnose reductase